MQLDSTRLVRRAGNQHSSHRRPISHLPMTVVAAVLADQRAERKAYGAFEGPHILSSPPTISTPARRFHSTIRPPSNLHQKITATCHPTSHVYVSFCQAANSEFGDG